MAGKIFVGNTNNLSSLATNILIGDTYHKARNVTSIFVGNILNKAVQVWPDGGGGGGLPDGYERIQYVRSHFFCNGFDTGLSGGANTRIFISFKFSSINFNEFLLHTNADDSNRGFGSAASPFYIMPRPSTKYTYDEQGYGLFLSAKKLPDDGGIDYYFRCCYSISTDSKYDILFYHSPNNIYDEDEVMENIGNALLNKMISVDLNKAIGTGNLYVDNSLVYTFPYNSFVGLDQSMWLLSHNFFTLPSYNYPSQVETKIMENVIDLYACYIYTQSNGLTRNFIPCRNISTGIPYLYDDVYKRLYECPHSNSYPPGWG